ncbi:MAG: hypothetical protein ABWZ85_02865 [Luteibacter sp.]
MGKPGKSLTRRLALRLSVLQTLILMSSIAALTFSILAWRASYIDDDVVQAVLGHVAVEGATLTMRDGAELR